RRWQVTTQADAALPVAPNRLARQFAVAQPNRVWAADLTYCWTQEGWLYLAVILDLCSRRVVGWATGPTPDAEVALAAWRRATALRQPAAGLPTTRIAGAFTPVGATKPRSISTR